MQLSVATIRPEYEDQYPLSRAYPSDAGIDLKSIAEAKLWPGEVRAVSTGIRLALPPNTVGLICPRSGLARKNYITVLNAPGIIDEAYRGVVEVLLFNFSRTSYTVREGDRIAQLLVVPILRPEITYVTTLPIHADNRGDDGFGSTGTA